MSHYPAPRSHADRNRRSHSFRRAFTVMLVIIMLSVQTPAAPPVISGVAADWQLGAALWFQSSGWAARLSSLTSGQRAPEPRAQERQAERDARVSRIQIYPGEVEVLTDERVHFTAVAYDRGGTPVGGVSFRWQGHDEGRQRAVLIKRTGEFVTRNEGNYKIVVEGAGQRAQVKVRVREDKARQRDEKPAKLKDVSTSDLPGENLAAKSPAAPVRRPRAQARDAQSPAFAKASFAHAVTTAPRPAVFLPPDDEYGWNSGNYMSSRDPDNERGRRPGRPVDDGAGSGNFQISAPVVSMPGRGIDISLGLTYNSRVWTKSGNNITFDADRDWPAPGWSLGFGKIIGMGMGGSLIIDPDGTRHGYDGSVYPYSNGAVSFTGHTTDGTFIDYSSYSDNTGIRSATTQLPNGTVIQYGAPGAGAVYPTLITEANGNYIVISYRNNSGPHIAVVTDTLGRTINFHYDGNDLLTAVTAPGLGDSPARQLVRLHYQQKTLNYNNFNLTTHVRFPDNVVWLVDAIYYPGTGTGYWFGDTDSYSSYGMIAKVTEQRGMGFSGAPVNEMGAVTPGLMTRQQVYDYPLTPNPAVYLSDAPTYETLTERWVKDDLNTSQSIVESTTTYKLEKNVANPNYPSIPSRKTTITRQTDGLKSIQYAYNYTSLAGTDPLKFKDGLIYQDETSDADNNLLQSSTVTDWQQGAYGSPRPGRTEIVDERGQKTATEFTYGAAYNQATEVREYDFGGTSLIRVMRTEYENGGGYIGRHIFSLVKKTEVFASNGVEATGRVSLTEYQYDGGTLAETPGVTMHSESSNPYAPWFEEPCECYLEYNQSGYQEYVCHSVCQVTNYKQSSAYRGNVTQVTKYADALNAGGAITETHTYDMTGNLRTTVSSCCDQTSDSYTANTQYAFAESQTRGAVSDQTKQLTTTTAYDFNTGLVNNATDANGHLAQTIYEAATLRPKTDYALKAGGPAGASYTTYDYNDTAMTVTQTVYNASNQLALQTVRRLNGEGEVRLEEAKAEGANKWDVVETQYDNLGRPSKQSIPFRRGSETPRWTTTYYDVLDRVKKVEAPDGSITETFYNEGNYPGAATQNAPGQTTRVKDAWGRERWSRADASGRIVEVVEPNPAGGGAVAEAGSLLTAYSYDTLGKLIGVTQGSQTRSFRYDSLGRLTRQKMAEANSSINDAGNYVGIGGQGANWSNAFAYDERSNLISRTDARGVVTTFSYSDAANNLDPLNRLQSISYATPVNSNIAAAATVTYTYRTDGDKTRLSTVTTAGVSTETYEYDSEGRISYKELKLDSRQAYPFRVDYTYDTLDRITDITYPTQYGTNSPRKVVHQDYDASSRLSGLQVAGANQASQINYNAASQATSLKIGSGANQLTESYGFDEQTGLLSGQTVYRGSDPANTLLDLSYSYVRAGTTGGRTGQLTAISDNRDHTRDRGYEYDALGRLRRASAGGAAGVWAQRYLMDRYGNRSHVLTQKTSNFVTALYNVVLNRAPDSGGLEMWNNVLVNAYAQGQSQFLQAAKDTAAGFFNSNEYVNRNRSNSDYVRDLYLTYLNREPDTSGWNGWTNALNNGATRATVMGGFAESGEFSNRVSGMYPGAVAATNAPAALTVTGSTATQVVLGWTAPTGGAAAAQYRVERRQSGSSAYHVVGNVTASATNFTDTTVSDGAAYLYRVVAVDANGYASPASNVALGAAVTFTDDTLVADVTVIRAQHLTELRQAVNAVRQLAGLAGAAWAEPIQSGGWIRAAHVQELRDRLGEALAALELSAGAYTDSVLGTGAQGTPVKKEHIAELRQRASRVMGAAVFGGATTTTTPAVAADGWGDLSFDSATNRINSAGWEYDAAGNQTRAHVNATTTQRFEYDAANRLVQVKTEAGALLAKYTYGATNERLLAEAGGARTYYAGDRGQVLCEYAEYGAGSVPQWAQSYIYLGGRLLSTLTPGNSGEVVRYHHPDRLGTRLVTNTADTTSFEQATLPYGTALNSESTGSTNRRFTSYDRSSATGLDYAVNRHYDSQQGRFTQVDPLGAGATDITEPQTWNMYSYCANDPVNRLDPYGLFFGRLFKWIGKALKWIALAALVASAILLTYGALAGPAAAMAFAKTTLGSILTFIANIPNAIGSFIAGIPKAIAGVFNFAEAGTSAIASIIGTGVLLGGSALAETIGERQETGKAKRRREKRERRAVRERPPNNRVRLPPGISTEPRTGKPEVPQPPRQQPPGIDPENPRFPDGGTRWARFKFRLALVLRAAGDYIKSSPAMIMVNPEAIQDAACRENRYSDLCRNGPFPGCCRVRGGRIM